MSEHPTDTQPRAELARSPFTPLVRTGLALAVAAGIGMVVILAFNPGTNVTVLRVLTGVGATAALVGVVVQAVRDRGRGAPR